MFTERTTDCNNDLSLSEDKKQLIDLETISKEFIACCYILKELRR